RMSKSRGHITIDRRGFLRRATTALATVALARVASAQDTLLESLMQQSQSGDFGQGFDAASRTVQMPKSSLPTLSPATVQTTEQAIPRYEAIVAQGGWPHIPPTDKLRLGTRHPSVAPIRQRLIAGGDLDVNSGLGDVYDSYVERAVR